MQIEANSLVTSKLSEINDGECFFAQFNKGKLKMKIHSTTSYIEHYGYRIIELDTGTEMVDVQDCDVIPVIAKVVIGD